MAYFKYIFLLLFLFILSPTANSNDLTDLILRSDSLLSSENVDSALSYSQSILRERSDLLEQNDSLKCKLLLNIALAFRAKHQFNQAENSAKRALDFAGKEIGEPGYMVGKSYAILSSIYIDGGYYDKSFKCLEKARDNFNIVFGPDNINTASLLQSMALIEMTIGRLSRAEPLYQQALKIYLRDYGENNIKTAICLRNIGALYNKKLMHIDAESYYKRALKIATHLYGDNSESAATLYIDLAGLYTSMFRYNKAESLLVRAIHIFESAPEMYRLYLAKSQVALGQLYFMEEKYDLAEPLFKASLEIRRDRLGPKHPDVAYSMDQLGRVYARQGRFDEAEPLIIKSVNSIRNRLGMSHTYTAYAYKRLGDFYMLKGDLQLAEQALDSSLEIMHSIYDDDSYAMVACYKSRRDLYLRQGNIIKAVDDAQKAIKLLSDAFFNDVITLPESDAINISLNIKEGLSEFLSIYFDHPSIQDNLRGKAIDLILFNKGLITDGIFERQLSAMMHNDSTTEILLDSLRTLKFEQSRLFVSNTDSTEDTGRDRKQALKSAITDTENTLVQNCANIGKWQKFNKLNRDRLIEMLPESTVYIDYFKYDRYLPAGDSSISHYSAIVLAHDQEPLLVDLGQAAPIDRLINQYRLHMLETAGHGGVIMADDQKRYFDIASSLYYAVWKPIAINIPEQNGMILIAPDDALNRVAFAGLVGDDNKYLIENYTIHYISSGRDLFRINADYQPGRGLLAIGDPDYNNSTDNCESDSMVKGSNHGARSLPKTVLRSYCGELENIRLSPLPGTRQEIDLVTKTWRKTTGEPAVIYSGNRASEKCFKLNAPGNRALHLATHGYFLDEHCVSDSQSENKDSMSRDNPLLLSGLFFSGVNKHDELNDRDGDDDGILTASEVTMINLSGVELVVLSACESGLGELQAGEGVFGLRRAFQMAGARTVICSLWPITDQSASDFFSHLYDAGNSTLAESLRAVQLDKINELRKNDQFDHPYNWGGFFIFGDWH